MIELKVFAYVLGRGFQLKSLSLNFNILGILNGSLPCGIHGKFNVKAYGPAKSFYEILPDRAHLRV